MKKHLSNTQKLLLASVIAALGLTACNKPAEKAAETPAATQQQATQPVATDADKQADNAKTEDHGDHDDHEHDDHDGHDHGEDGHMHSHDDGITYQCGDKNINIAVHEHEGEIEAHVAYDGISYDFNKDPKADRYTTDDGINDKDNVLTIKGDKATITDANNKTILDCTKAS